MAMEHLTTSNDVTPEKCMSGDEEMLPDQDHDDHEPAVGMSFLSGSEFARFCFKYAYKIGFSIFRRNSVLLEVFKEAGVSRKGVKENEPQFHMMKEIRFVCTKGGKRQSQGSTVTNCPCFIYGKMNDAKFVIKTCNLTHNHPMDPSCSRLLTNYKVIDNASYEEMVNKDEAGISQKKNYNSFVVEHKGPYNLTFDERDMRNAINVHRLKSRISGDAVAMEEYFDKMTKDNNNFFYRVQRDKNNRLVNVFWADARTREAYKEFGDVVTFDTTFLCNRYAMPFAPFIGINHHGKSMVLGAALISHEDTESFVWVFQQWLECMGETPKGIITDQDQAIGNAVSLVFPDVPHRLCIWHILENASRHLGSHSKWKEIHENLQVVVHDSLTPEEFDDAWKDMIKKFRLENNTWLQGTYAIRMRWAPGYWKNSFWAGMSSTQRSESMNRFFKTYVSANSGLRKFVEQYKMALVDKVEEEKKMNFACKNTPLPCDDTIIVESIFHKLYTNEKFKEVKEETQGLTHTNVTKVGNDGLVVLYEAVEKIRRPVWKKGKSKIFSVTVNRHAGEFSCSCKLFEFRGILCRHIIRAIDLEDVMCIPEKYILNRWRKDVLRSYEDVKVEYCDPNASTRIQNSIEVSQRNTYLSRLALHNDETLAIFKESTDNLRQELEAVLGITRTGMSAHWFDPSMAAVYGVRRIRPKHCNQRHLQRSAKHVEGATKDPHDKFTNGRKPSKRAKLPSERGRGRGGTTARRNRTKRQEEEALLEEEDDASEPSDFYF